MLEPVINQSFMYIIQLMFFLTIIVGVLFCIFEIKLFKKKKSKAKKYFKKAKRAAKQNDRQEFWKNFERHKKYSKSKSDIFNQHYLNHLYWKIK